jgi:hypothetical protein
MSDMPEFMKDFFGEPGTKTLETWLGIMGLGHMIAITRPEKLRERLTEAQAKEVLRKHG